MDKVNDIISDAKGLSVKRKVESLFQSVFDSYGFQRISLPIIESSELFLKKLGDKIKSQIYTFKDSNNNEMALRPEMTSPVIKYFLDNHRNDSLPMRFCYSGRVFRRNEPNSVNSEEFTHIGAEILGVNSILDDIESITMAWTCIEKLDIGNCRVTLGNLGIITRLVHDLDVDISFKNYFLENLRQKKSATSSNQPSIEELLSPDSAPEYGEILSILKKLSPEEEKLLVTKLLNLIHPHFSEDQDEATDVVEGVLAKIKRQNQVESIHRVMELSTELQNIKGEPDTAIKEAREVLISYDINTKNVDELEMACQSMISYGIAKENIVVDFGLGRNLQYYTGIIYEIHCDGRLDNEYICGGGRYDDLIRVLGHSMPLSGCGFAFNLEKVSNILSDKMSGANWPGSALVDVYILVQDSQLTVKFFSMLASIRGEGISVSVESFNQSYKSQLDDLSPSKCPLAVVIDGEIDLDSLSIHDLQARTESKLSIAELIEQFGKIKPL